MMDRWSVETWLMQMLTHARRRGIPVDWTFYCTFGLAGSKDEAARALGARVINTPVEIGDKRAFIKALREELKRGQYDVVHCQHDLISGIYLVAAAGLPIGKRIVHVHNPDEAVLTPSRLKQAIFKPILRNLCLLLADKIVANSQHSLDVFLAGRRPRRGRDLIHYLGIDTAPFEGVNAARADFRERLGLAPHTPILLFAGRVTPEKNPVFTIDVLAALRKRMPNVVAVFAGSGSLEEDVRRRSRELGQEDAVHYLGWRDDIPEVMSVCDWFILPHPEDPMEGFGIAVVEAQLAGLRLLLSKGVGDDPLLPTAAFRRLSLEDDVDKWAQAAVDLWNGPAPSREEALYALKASRMDMDYALQDLLELHR